jgi:predicted Ser/Thr protein kinase
MMPWTFATKRAEVTPSSTTLAFGDSFVYDKPLDAVRIYKVYNKDYHEVRYKIEGQNIICNEESQIYLVYISNSVNEALYDPIFKEALSLRLAADMAYSFTKSTSSRGALNQEAEVVMLRAFSKTSQEVYNDDMDFDYFNNTRRTGPYREGGQRVY